MSSAPSTGQQFGSYKLDEVLGRGGMGVVFRAEHTHLNRTVALKVLAPELSADANFRARFLHESRTAAALDHPNVVTVYDAGEWEGSLYLAMRLVPGEDLSSVLSRRGVLSGEESLAMLSQVADALDAAHAAGLVHRDVKPGNVLVDGNRCFLTDFGLTKQTQSDMTAMTATGVFLGTPDYAAPEQVSGAKVDARTDVYALGGVLHQCLTGSRPFPRDSQIAVLYAQLHEPPPRPSETRPGLPAALDDVIARALAKAPSHRYATCNELIEAARKALAGHTAPTRAAAPAPTALGAPATPAHPEPATPAAGGVPPTAPGAPQTSATAALGPEPPTTTPPPEYTTVRRGRSRAPLFALLALGVVAVIAAVVLLAGGGDDTSKDAGGGGGGAQGGGDASSQPKVVDSTEVGARPFGVAAGEGVNWVANNDDDTVTRITPDGASRTDINVGNKPFGVTRAGGAVWVVNTGSDSVTRIDVKTGKASDEIPVGKSPFFAAADESSVFVANGEPGDGTISVLDARSGKPVGDPIQVGGELRGIASSGSAIWVADKSTNTVKRIVNNRVVKTIKVGKNPVSVAFGANALWVTNKESDTVSRVDLSGSGNKVRTIRVGEEPYGAAFGAGFAWITNVADNTVMRLDPKTGKVVGDPIPVEGQPVAVAVGKDGRVWVTSNDAGTLTRIDP